MSMDGEGVDLGVDDGPDDLQQQLDDDQDEGNADVDEEEDVLPHIMGPDDPLRMKLTPQEYRWALDIKDAIEMEANLDNLSDFMYAQLALICEDDLEDAVQRAHALQDFRQEYNIVDVFGDGSRFLQERLRMNPGEFISYSYSQQDGTYVLVFDMSKAHIASLNMREHAFFAGIYYLHTAFCPDLETIRKGIIVLIECSELDWSMKKNFKLTQQAFRQLISIFPYTVDVRYFHTGVFANVMTSMLNSVLPAKLKSKFRTGYKFDGGLSSYFLVPNVEAATERVILRLQETLHRRYEKDRSFFLTEDATVLV